MKAKITATYESIVEGKTLEEIKDKYVRLPFNPSLAFVDYVSVTDMETGNEIMDDYKNVYNK